MVPLDGAAVGALLSLCWHSVRRKLHSLLGAPRGVWPAPVESWRSGRLLAVGLGCVFIKSMKKML